MHIIHNNNLRGTWKKPQVTFNIYNILITLLDSHFKFPYILFMNKERIGHYSKDNSGPMLFQTSVYRKTWQGWPRLKSWMRCHLWFELAVGFCPCSKRTFCALQFSSIPKTNISKSRFDQEWY